MAEGDSRCHLEIIAEAQRGDHRALHALYEATAPRLLGYVRSLIGPDDADDVASETWTRILIDLPAYRTDRGDFHSWAAAIARYRAIDHLRRNRRAVPIPADWIGHEPAPQDTERDAVDALATAEVLTLISTLPRDQAAAVLLRVVLGMDAVSAGRVLRKRPGAVRTATHRGLHSLRARLGGAAES